jgi:glycosyltransferase involved in cell wall biosynthesis
MAEKFVEENHHVIFIYDQQIKELPSNTEYYTHLTWPNFRPSKLKDFLFLKNIISTYKPTHCIAIFGSVNVMMIVSYFMRVKNRISWIRTTNTQILIDSKNTFKSKLKVFRKAFIYKLATQVYANSNGTQRDALKTFKIPKHKIRVLHNLVRPSQLSAKLYKDREEKLCIVGRLDKSKGHDILIKQFLYVVDAFPNLKLEIVGDGPEMEHLVELKHQLGLTNNVTFLGKLPYDEVEAVFSKSLIGVSASHSEAFGWVNIESLREGTPIISTATEGAKDILISEKNGYFFDLEDHKSLLKAVQLILEHWNAYSEMAIATFNDNFNLRTNIKTHYLEIKSNSIN